MNTVNSKKTECLVAIGRFNPPHKGHLELLESGEKYAKENNLDYIICPTNTQNCIINPLFLDQKIKFLSLIVPEYKNNILFNKYPTALAFLTRNRKNYNSLMIEEFLKSVGYTKIYVYHSDKTFSPIDTIKGPERRLDKLSATKIRKAVVDNDFNRFVDYYTLKTKSLNNKIENSDELKQKNKNAVYKKYKSIDDSIINVKNNATGSYTTGTKIRLIGSLKIKNLIELFEILKTQLSCKSPLIKTKQTNNINKIATRTHSVQPSLLYQTENYMPRSYSAPVNNDPYLNN
jgi:nicotinamide mononucleotide adenylyltransferase